MNHPLRIGVLLILILLIASCKSEINEQQQLFDAINRENNNKLEASQGLTSFSANNGKVEFSYDAAPGNYLGVVEMYLPDIAEEACATGQNICKVVVNRIKTETRSIISFKLCNKLWGQEVGDFKGKLSILDAQGSVMFQKEITLVNDADKQKCD